MCHNYTIFATIGVMKRLFLEYVPAWLLLTVFLLIVMHAPLTVYVGTHWPAIALPVKAWKEVCIALAALLVGWQVVRHRLWYELRSDMLAWLVLGFWAIHIGALAWTRATSDVVIAGLLIDLRYTLYAATVYCFVRLYPQYGVSFMRVGAVGAVIVLGFACLQTVIPADSLKYLGYGDATIEPYLTVDKNPAYVRLNSTLRGPNPLGAYAVVTLAAGVAYLLYRWRGVWKKRENIAIELVIIGSLIALWRSYSRSALLAGVVVIVLLLAARFGRQLTRRAWYWLAAMVVVLALVAAGIRNTNFVQNVVLHDNPTTGASIDSNAGHATSLIDGVKRAAAQPFGSGIGSTGSASLMGNSPLIIENQFLMIAHEAGWAALALFIGITVAVLRRLWRLRPDWVVLATWASGIGMIIIGLLLPVWADDTVSLVWWGLAAAVLAKGEVDGATTDKEAA